MKVDNNFIYLIFECNKSTYLRVLIAETLYLNLLPFWNHEVRSNMSKLTYIVSPSGIISVVNEGFRTIIMH